MLALRQLLGHPPERQQTIVGAEAATPVRPRDGRRVQPGAEQVLKVLGGEGGGPIVLVGPGGERPRASSVTRSTRTR